MLIHLEKESVCRQRFEDGLELWEICSDRITEFSLAVYSVYADHSRQRDLWETGFIEYGNILKQDILYGDVARYFAITGAGGKPIVTTGRVMKKRPGVVVPTEAVFGLDVVGEALRRNIPETEVYHGGRLTVNKKVLADLGFPKSKSAELFVRIHAYCMASLQPAARCVFVGELDRLALRIYRFNGIPTETLGDAVDYHGWPAYPVLIEPHKATEQHWLRDLSRYYVD